jgi:hypothetical protein|tara:strand:+ start:314 stop:571 length:258 start_codon:yes stop_codon:yes gene_type:complete
MVLLKSNKINKCDEKKCLLNDREEDISIYIDHEITALIQRIELRNTDVHPGCLHVLVKKHLEYQSVKIFAELMEKYPGGEEVRIS